MSNVDLALQIRAYLRRFPCGGPIRDMLCLGDVDDEGIIWAMFAAQDAQDAEALGLVLELGGMTRKRRSEIYRLVWHGLDLETAA